MSTDQSTQHRPEDDADAGLRVALRSALAQGDGTRLHALEDRVLAQWEMRAAAARQVSVGPVGVLGGGWQSKPLRWGLVAVVIAGALGVQALRMAAAPPLDDLLEPDVLSLVAFGEL
jgi:hypothetical protein